MTTRYCLPDDNLGHDPCPIMMEHWGIPGMKTILLSKEKFEDLCPWELVSLLNKAYEHGRTEYKNDLRDFLGIK